MEIKMLIFYFHMILMKRMLVFVRGTMSLTIPFTLPLSPPNATFKALKGGSAVLGEFVSPTLYAEQVASLLIIEECRGVYCPLSAHFPS